MTKKLCLITTISVFTVTSICLYAKPSAEINKAIEYIDNETEIEMTAEYIQNFRDSLRLKGFSYSRIAATPIPFPRKMRLKTTPMDIHKKEVYMMGGINGQDAAGQAEGHLTSDLIGDKLKTILGDENWTYRGNLYPTLKGFEFDTIAIVAASPVYLDVVNSTDYDKHNNVRKNFTVSLANNVSWTSVVGNVEIVGNEGRIINDGEDTLVAFIKGYKKVIPIKIKKTTDADEFHLSVVSNPEGTGTSQGSGYYKKGDKAIIEAVAHECYKFVNWTNANGTPLSTKATDTITVTKDSVLTANFVIDSFDLVLQPNPANGGTVTAGNRYACGDTVNIVAVENAGYRFLNWTNDKGNIISTNAIEKITIKSNTFLTANFVANTPVNGIKFTIKASEHKLVDPNSLNYKIPIYIQADKDISDLVIINKLVIEIDKYIFYPRGLYRADNNIGVTINRNSDVSEMILENITIPKLVANTEAVLLTVRGDVLLGDKDSNDIVIKSIKFSEELIEEPNLINGHITLDICREGGDRLLRFFEYPPSITVKNNPIADPPILNLECKVVENGIYTLEIVDMAGYVVAVKKFEADVMLKTIYNFEIPVQYAIGSYIVIMNTPTERFSAKFILKK